jgi:hypothetical protein
MLDLVSNPCIYILKVKIVGKILLFTRTYKFQHYLFHILVNLVFSSSRLKSRVNFVDHAGKYLLSLKWHHGILCTTIQGLDTKSNILKIFPTILTFKIYRITSVLSVETDIITSIAVSLDTGDYVSQDLQNDRYCLYR